MKTLRLTAVFCLLLGAIVSCNKNSNNTQPNTSSTDEAADLVTASLSTSTQGALSSTADITVSAQAKFDVDSLCGETWTDSVNRSIPLGQHYKYDFKAKYTYVLDCGTVADTVKTTSNYSGSFVTPNLTSTFSGSSNFSIGGVGRRSTQYTINGEYKRSGSFQSATDTSYEGTHNVDITLNNLVLIKPLNIIKSGSASFTISGNMPKRGSFNYTGTIVFNGGDNATLTINGQGYMINLSSRTKKRI